MERPSGHRINHRDDRKPSLSARRGAGDAILYEDDASIDDADEAVPLLARRPDPAEPLPALNDNRLAMFRGGSIPAE